MVSVATSSLRKSRQDCGRLARMGSADMAGWTNADAVRFAGERFGLRPTW